MTDRLPMHWPDESPATPTGAKGARPRKSDDPVKARRGKSADRLGKDQERRIERVYGPRKVGEYGDAVDHLGRDFKWQAKATRKLPPKWLAAITEPTRIDGVPESIRRPYEHMASIGGDRYPLVIRSYVRHGVPTRDWMFVSAWHWGTLHNFPATTILGWVVIPGADFLEIHGPDAA